MTHVLFSQTAMRVAGVALLIACTGSCSRDRGYRFPEITNVTRATLNGATEDQRRVVTDKACLETILSALNRSSIYWTSKFSHWFVPAPSEEYGIALYISKNAVAYLDVGYDNWVLRSGRGFVPVEYTYDKRLHSCLSNFADRAFGVSDDVGGLDSDSTECRCPKP